MTDPLATHTSFASAIRSTKMPPLVVAKQPRNLTGLLLLGGMCAVGLGAVVYAGTRNDRVRKEGQIRD